MEGKKYCILALDNVEGLEDDLKSITNDPIEVINSAKRTVLIATFNSVLSPVSLKKLLDKGNRRSFFIFELNAKVCSVHIDDEDLQKFLFKQLDIDGEILIEEENKEFVEIILNNNLNDGDIEYNERDLIKLTKEEKTILMDKLLSKINTLTNNEKKVLDFLANL